MKKAAASVLALTVLAGMLVKADEKKAVPFEVEIVKDVPYSDSKDADPVRHKLDLYLPKSAKDYPVFFFIHGGGWTQGSKNGFAAHGNTFAKNGVAFVSVNYRLTPTVKHPGHIEDVAQAFAWVVANLGKRGANLEQIYVSGHSAGGHLAALLGTDESRLKAHKLSLKNIKGVVPVSGVFSISSRMSKSFGGPDSCKNASPITHVKEGLPPFLILYGDAEAKGLGKQAEDFAKALEKAKVSVEVKNVADRNHGTIMRNIAKEDDVATTAIFAFIRKNGGFTPSK